MYCLNPVKSVVDKPSLLKLYYSMIHSNISYGININGCANTTNLEKIQRKQKQAIRIVCNAPFRAHTAPLFKELKILPLDQLIEYSRIKFMHCFHFKNCPPPSMKCGKPIESAILKDYFVMLMIYMYQPIVLNL
jgi:hypothetical protein